jgi:hypothetical protein
VTDFEPVVIVNYGILLLLFRSRIGPIVVVRIPGFCREVRSSIWQNEPNFNFS